MAATIVPASRAKTSKVWDHFTLNSSKTRITCSICQMDLAYHGSTTTMREHLKRKHFGYLEESLCAKKSNSTNYGFLLERQPCTPQQVAAHTDHALDGFVQMAPLCSTETAERCTDSILHMIVKDMRPLSMVEDEGFQEMIKVLNPSYSLPSKDSFKEMMESEYEGRKMALKSILQGAAGVALTADVWTSVPAEAYLGVMCHFVGEDWSMQSYSLSTTLLEDGHTAEIIAEWLESVVASFDISPDKINAVVHDNSANVVAAVKILSDKHGWTSVACAGHTLNLVVECATSDNQTMTTCVAAARGLVRHFRVSELASSKLKDKQQKMGTPHQALVSDQSSCWNSTYLMLARLLEQRWPLTAALSDLAVAPKGRPDLDLKPEQWAILEEFCQAVEPFDGATVILRGHEYVTLSAIPHLVHSLSKSIQSLSFDTSAVQLFQTQVMEQISIRWHELSVFHDDFPNKALLAAALDPRFRKLKFLSPQEAFKVKSIVQSIAFALSKELKQIKSDETESVVTTAVHTPKPGAKSSFIAKVLGPDTSDEEEEDEEQKMNQTVQNEVLVYFGDHPAAKREDPLSWWRTNATRFPTLSKLARVFLCIPATSMPAELLFSAPGNVASKLRAGLSAEHVDMQVFLHHNHTLKNHIGTDCVLKVELNT
ncbi:E3 SUMO-protein ligase ZBED1-like [Synchiropus picturatus]